MFTSRLARSVRATVLATTLALVPATGLVVLAPAAHADGGKEWTGEGDGHTWSDDNNWSGNQAPQEGDEVAISSPDSKGATVHVVGAPSMALGGLTLHADGNATVALDGADLSVNGGFSWDSGTLNANVSLGPLSHGSISSGGKKYLYGDISVGPGAGLLMSGVSGTSDLTIDDPHKITISTGAAMATLGTNDISGLACCVHPAKIVNNGIIEMGPGSLNLTTVELDQLGRIDATFGPSLTTEKAPVVIASNARFSGTGSLRLGAVSDTRVAGKIRIGGDYVVEQAGGTLNGTGQLIGGGQWHFTGGTVYGTLINQPGNLFSVQGPGTKSLGVYTANEHGVLDNHGVLEVTEGTVAMAGATRLLNESDGTMRLVPGVTLDGLTCCVAPALLENHGNLSVTAPLNHGDPVVPVTISHAGLYSDSEIAITDGQTLELASGPSQLVSPATIGGRGTLSLGGSLIASSTIKVKANSTIRLHDNADVIGEGLVLGGSGSTIDWLGGSLHGFVDFPAGTTVNLGSGDVKRISAPNAGTTLVTTEGTTTIAAGVDADHPNRVDIGSGQKWLNKGALTVHGSTSLTSGSCCVSPARLDNTGTLHFAPETGTTVDVGGVEVHNSGGTVTVDSATTAIRYPSYVQDAGTTVVANGATFGQTNFSSPLQLRGGTLTGRGTLTGTVANDGGTVAPGASAAAGTIGTLTMTGQYFQGPGGHLDVDIAKTTHDQVVVGGNVRLAGVVSGVSKGGAVDEATSATVLTAGNIAGVADCTLAPGTTTRAWTAAATATALTLTAGPAAKAGCDVFAPLTPARVAGPGTLVQAGHDVTVKLAGKAGVPATGVDAVALNVSAANATKAGVLSIGPAGVAVPTGETLRYVKTKPASNVTTVRVSADGKIVLHVSAGSARVYLDVAGWYGDAQLRSDGDLYHAVTPALVGTPTVEAGTDVDLTVGGKGGIPDDGITAVTLAVQISDPTQAGSLSVVPGGATVTNTITQSFSAGQTANAVVTVPVSGQQVRLHLSLGTAEVTVRSLGYFTPRASGGSYFKGGVPTRIASVFTDSASSPAVNLLSRPGVPQFGAVSYLLGVHITAPTEPAALSVGSLAAGAPLVRAVDAVRAGDKRSGSAAPTPDAFGAIRLKLADGTATVLLDLDGYYIG